MNFLIGSIYAMAAPPGGGQGQQNWFTTLIPLAIIFAIFYFLMIRPQQKQQRKHREMVSAMRKGDKVITRGGMHGVIHSIADNLVTIEVAENVRVKFNRDAIAAVSPPTT